MQVQENFQLKKYNTFGIDVLAQYFSTFTSEEELELLLNDSKNIGETMILGGGSNILFTKNFKGLVLKNDIPGITVTGEDEDHVYVQAGAGVNWHSFVMYCVDHNYGGVENLSLIPGNVGASPMQNIGAYGVELKDVFYKLEAFHVQEKVQQIFNVADCEFSYRESVFKKKYQGEFVIMNATFRLNKKPQFNISYGSLKEELERMDIIELSIQAISQAVIHIRSSRLPDPKEIGNAGSFFKNPEVSKEKFETLKPEFENIQGYQLDNGNIKLSAGWLIEQCGWKGYRRGDAGCHAKHALVLVNYGNASGKEVYDLSEEIKQSVKKNFNVSIEREVNII